MLVFWIKNNYISYLKFESTGSHAVMPLGRVRHQLRRSVRMSYLLNDSNWMSGTYPVASHPTLSGPWRLQLHTVRRSVWKSGEDIQFCHREKMAACCQDVHGEGKAEGEDTSLLGSLLPKDLNIYRHCCEEGSRLLEFCFEYS